MQRFAEGDCLALQHAAQLRKKKQKSVCSWSLPGPPPPPTPPKKKKKKKLTKQLHIQPLNITYIHCLISKIINLQR